MKPFVGGVRPADASRTYFTEREGGAKHLRVPKKTTARSQDYRSKKRPFPGSAGGRKHFVLQQKKHQAGMEGEIGVPERGINILLRKGGALAQSNRKEKNRLVVVGVSVVVWLLVLRFVADWFDVNHALILAVWIAMGSKHYATSLKDFERPLKLETLAGLVLMAPAWPVLYWQAKQSSQLSDEE